MTSSSWAGPKKARAASHTLRALASHPHQESSTMPKVSSDPGANPLGAAIATLQQLKNIPRAHLVTHFANHYAEILDAITTLCQAAPFKALNEQYQRERDDALILDLATLMRESLNIPLPLDHYRLWVIHHCDPTHPFTPEESRHLSRAQEKLAHLRLNARCEFTRHGHDILRYLDLYELHAHGTRRYRHESRVPLDDIPLPLRQQLIGGELSASHLLF